LQSRAVHKPKLTACTIVDLGLIEYLRAWKLQEEYSLEIARGERPPTLLLLEHHHVYTFGRKGHAENLLWGEQQLKERGLVVHWVDRGGDVTYHGPGQLVGYPLVPLGRVSDGASVGAVSGEYGGKMSSPRILGADYLGYLRKLERTLIVALARLGLPSGQEPGLTGVWVQSDVYSRCARCRPQDRQKPAKIAAIGVKVDVRGISRHGFALNVNPDMTYWDGINACGLTDHPVVSLADLLSPVPEMDRVKMAVAAAFGEVFGYEIRAPA
jgi:lipoate-protein ligase B